MTERQYTMDIKRKCTALGVWRDEFERTQRRLAKIYTRIDGVEKLYEESGGEPVITVTNNKGHENTMRNPIIAELDILYEQAMQHERELGLTAAALRKINESALHAKEESPLAGVLSLIQGREAG